MFSSKLKVLKPLAFVGVSKGLLSQPGAGYKYRNVSLEAGSGCQVLEDGPLDHRRFQARCRLGEDRDYQGVRIANVSRINVSGQLNQG